VNGQCLCTMPDPVDPEKEKCEQKSYCDWVNGQCLCTGLGGVNSGGLLGNSAEA
jgi:hypothetical protein